MRGRVWTMAAAWAVLLWPAWAWAEPVASTGAGAAARWPMIGAGAVAIVVGLVLSRAKASWSTLSTGWRLARGVGIVLATLGGLMALFAITEAPPMRSSGGELTWYKDAARAEAAARAQGKPMMVDFTADWCGACQELEAEVFHAESVRDTLRREVVLLKIDFDRNRDAKAMRKRFEVQGLPRVAFVSPGGEFLRGESFEGKLGEAAFRERLDRVIAGRGSTGGGGRSLADEMAERGLLGVLLLVFGAGLLSSLTPCVYPLIPITISIFGARQASSHLQGFLLSLSYVLGIAVSYSVMGVVAASFGMLFGNAMQSPWVLVGIAVVFGALALSSFGVFHFRVPGRVQDLLGRVGRAGHLGAFLMGLFAGILAAPCVGPIVTGILVYVAQRQDVLLGWVLLMTFALGMGVLFLVLGTFSSLLHKMPKSGTWLETVKGVFGVIFLVMALYYVRFALSPIGEALEHIWLVLDALYVG